MDINEEAPILFGSLWLPGVTTRSQAFRMLTRHFSDQDELKPMSERITRDVMLTEMAVIASKRSTCSRKRVGAIIALDGRVLSIGYAGSPAGTPHCTDVGCLIGPEGGCVRTVHAELNAIAFAAKQGISLNHSTLYCTDSPCLSCAKAIINAGIIAVRYIREYRDLSGLELLNSANIDWGKVPYQFKL